MTPLGSPCGWWDQLESQNPANVVPFEDKKIQQAGKISFVFIKVKSRQLSILHLLPLGRLCPLGWKVECQSFSWSDFFLFVDKMKEDYRRQGFVKQFLIFPFALTCFDIQSLLNRRVRKGCCLEGAVIKFEVFIFFFYFK